MPGGGRRRAERARVLDRRERRAEPGAEAAWLAGTGRGRRRARPEPRIPSRTKKKASVQAVNLAHKK
jgi:hypothetical protein